MSLDIKKFFIENPYFSAPIAGFSDLPYRLISREAGCGLCWSELIMARGLCENNRKTMSYLTTVPEDHPLVVQLGGNEPEYMAKGARIAQDAGAEAICLNSGCPAPKMTKKGYGAGLMRTPEKVGDIVNLMKSETGLPVYVKIRAGFTSAHPAAVLVASIAEQAGADAVTVHGRFREDFFRGKSDWNVISEVKKAVTIPVIGNGDIHSFEDAQLMFKQTNCDAVMIGRASIGNPWIFTELLKKKKIVPSPDERLNVIDRHIELLEQYYGNKLAYLKARALLCYYTRGIPHIRHIRPEIIKITSYEDYKKIRKIILDYLLGHENKDE